MATWADVRRIGDSLPEVEEGTIYGMPALKVRGKSFAWMSPYADALCLRVDPDERPLMVDSQPDVYYVIPHYENYPIVLVRLDAVAFEDVRDRMTDSWLLVAPRPLARAFISTADGS